MISQIRMEQVASFKEATTIDSDKRVNLIYGLNGTGKTTISDFLYGSTNPRYNHCRIVATTQSKILVYNRAFINDHFFVADGLKGIFTLSKENKRAEERILEAQATIRAIMGNRGDTEAKKQDLMAAVAQQAKDAVDEVWKIKQDFSGGDRVLEYCLDGLKGDKSKLYSHVASIERPKAEPSRSASDIKEDVEILSADGAAVQKLLPALDLSVAEVEEAKVLAKVIEGSKDNDLAALITRLENADWVRVGMSFLSESSDDGSESCPFCQEKTITTAFRKKLREYFDEVYEEDLQRIRELQRRYNMLIAEVPNVEVYANHPLIGPSKALIEERHRNLLTVLKSNANSIQSKLAQPSIPIALVESSAAMTGLNTLIMAVNEEIQGHNDRLQNRDNALVVLKNEFWQIMRWKYDPVISRHERDKAATTEKVQTLEREIKHFNDALKFENDKIVSAQKDTVNTQMAVDAINGALIDLGMNEFRIVRLTDTHYRIERPNQADDVFRTLSEGEKMIISFLYFCELCTGKSSPDEADVDRIAVIDDPISSLSHVFVFNVGQMIKSRFFSSRQITQVFVLTHSLYFFYELAEKDSVKRRDNQRLFRLTKPSSGSSIQVMKYEEVRNDYDAYWSIINDPTTHQAVIANCMRNIVEYFFGFIRHEGLKNVFQSPELQAPRFQTFYRYINRESHSDGQNITDLKEFDYDIFREGLLLVFQKSGYPEHFAAMSKL